MALGLDKWANVLFCSLIGDNMELYILRHGIAVEHGTAGYQNDSERPLTPEG